MNQSYHLRLLLLIALPAACLLLFSGAGNSAGHYSQPRQTPATDSIPAYFLSGECGTVVSPEQVAAFDAMQRDIDAFTEEFLEKSGQMAMVTIPIKAHIIRRSNGTGGLTLSAWYAALQNLNTLFQPGNLQFAECGPPNIIHSDTYFDFHGSEEAALHNTYGVANVMNVYIPGGELLTSSGTGACGYANYPWAGAPNLMLVASSCMTSGNTFAHEVGHYLGLYHTHGPIASCGPLTDELVNGSNCATAGDRVCDTPADPGLRTGSNCENSHVNANCIYTGTATDANGQAFMPNTRNIMSYSRHECRDHFSTQQLARMYFYATTPPRSNLVCTPCSNAPVNLSVTSTGYSHISLAWDSVPGAVTYQTRVRRLPNGSWELDAVGSPNTGRTWAIRIPCSEYEIQVRVNCGNGFGPYSPPVTTQTLGCGDNYCYSYGLSWNQWIAGVNMANINNPSGNGYGHSNFTNLQANVEKGQSYPITLTPGTNVAGTTVYWRVWIDYNSDGDFTDAGELALTVTGNSTTPVSTNIAIPQSAAIGTTRMRVTMSNISGASSCATGNTRDVEDYTINIQAEQPPCSAPANLSVVATGYSHIWINWDSVPGAVSYQTRIRKLPDGNWTDPTSDLLSTGVLWSLTIPCSTYELQVRTNCGSGYGPYSESITAQTQGCGDNYCYSYGLSWNQWVAGVNLSNLNNPSGNGYGHSNFTNLQVNIVRGQSYPVTLTPGTNAASTTVYWRVWIDYNGDGDFEDAGEQVVSMTGNSLSPVTANITIPQSAATGATRMRVTMSTGGYSTSCAINSSARDVEDYTINIQPSVQQPVANFVANTTSGTAPLSVQFTDQSTNTPSSWLWNFGNGQTSTQQNPSVTYNSAGTYTVSLTATNSAGANTFTRTAYITVSPAVPWTAVPTGENHTVIIPATLNATLDGAPLQNGDVIGFFYEHNGSLHCSNFIAITGVNNSVAVYGNDANPPAKNGFATGEPFKVKIYKASTQQEFDAQVTYAPVGTAGIVTHTHQYANDGISMLSGLTASTATVLDIPLQQGWNMISSYVQPAVGNMLEVFSPIAAATILVKDNLGATTIPSLNINNIGAWQIEEGYKVRVNANTTLSITGSRVDPSATPIPVAPGWQIISYLREQQASAPTVLASISGIVEVLKDNAGNSYIPEFGINTIGNLRPTQGYKLKASGAGTLSYPPNFAPDGPGHAVKNLAGAEKRSLRYFVLDSTLNTGNNSLIIFPASAAGAMMEQDDEIGVFTAAGILCGAGVFQGNNFAVTVWGDDATTPEIVEGMAHGEAYVFKIWKNADDLELPLQVTFAQGSGLYAEDAVDVVGSLQIVSAVENVHHESLLLSVFPNPASDEFFVRLPEGIQVLEIRDATGRLLQRIAQPGEALYRVDTAGLPKGLLLLSARDAQGRQWYARVVRQ